MSLSELFIIFIVAILVLKPSDIPVVLKSLKKLYRYFLSIKKEFESEIKKISDSDEEDLDSQQINFYLKKISDLGEVYKGEYNKEDIKIFYHKIALKRKISSKKSEESEESKPQKNSADE